ncbi:MAG: TIR domain-containing protein, partial [Solirubrobacteraceae bacterium]
MRSLTSSLTALGRGCTVAAGRIGCLTSSFRIRGWTANLSGGWRLRSRPRANVWVDVDGIRDGEVFPEALCRAIESSDAFVFVISPDSVRSSFCEEEVEHAAALNKRIVPLSPRPVTDEDLPREIRFRNWIPAGGDGELDGTVERLVTALDTDLEWERQHSRVTVKALEWDQSGRDRSFLLRGSDLGAAERWLAAGAERDPGPTALEAEYLAAGRRATARTQRGLAVGSVAMAAVAIGLLIFALISRSAAVGQALTSDAERVGAQSLVEKNLDLAMLYAVLGVRLQNREQTRSDLLAELQNNSFAIRYIRASHDLIASLAVDPHGRLLAMGDSAGVVRFEDMSRWTASGPSVALRGSIPNEAMAFSPNGDTLAVITVGGTPEGLTQAGPTKLYAIDVRTRRVRLLGSWRGVVSAVPYPGASLAYDPTGRHIALSVSGIAHYGSVPWDTLRLLDAKTGHTIWQRQYPLRSGQLEARLAFAPDGTLVSSAQQGDTLLWNARTGHIERRFPIGGQPAISPDGGRVALAINNADLGNANSRVATLDLHTGRHRFLPASLPNVWLRGFAFTPDGKTLVGSSVHGDVYIWDVARGSITQTIPAPPGARASEVLDPTGRTVLVGSQAGSVVAFDLEGSRRLGRAFHWNTPEQSCGFGVCMVVNRQSDLMAAYQANRTVALVDLRTLQKVATLPARAGAIAAALAFSPDGRTRVTGGITGYLTLWDTAARKVTRRIKVGAPVWYADVSPDGRLLGAQTQAQNATAAHVQVRTVVGGKPLWTRVVPDGTGGLYFSP